ncbi:helix-turn-helix transcriptional regulator [Nonomuraea rubra]|uniref:helix-turn-helix domain-containing protein n=1 Tax=Nonomuraea rubra TaxID=46180 RepID=UPI0031E57B83
MRRWRDRVTPETVGLAAGGHRRAAGLRREELALLAGISADYVTRLEQGRATNPSPQVVEALARALAAGRRTSGRTCSGRPAWRRRAPDTVAAFMPASVHRMLDRLSGTPVGVYDAAWTLLLANPMYAALMGDPSGWRGNERNACGATSHRGGRPGQVHARGAARFEAHDGGRPCVRPPGSIRRPAAQAADRELRARSERFAELWDTVGRRAARRAGGRSSIIRRWGADAGLRRVLSVAGSNLRVHDLHGRARTEDAERLALLGVLGTQSMVG